ncbi:MAG: lysine 2,3-aminomutase [Desulfuromonas sp.]|uniref:KamA family radical SAM protein n=1 Tax=Desulfuromonas sp. TaxID=892 RepID=UPI000CB5A21A|nr:KamA family radical SAM protein [Desulfuromonas sp.]PLX82195.1 MAG: lysine 2,3-aminomutase [Desulfuromonas sp.]
MELWQERLKQSITTPEELAERFGIDPVPLEPVVQRYPLRITPHYAGLIQEVGDAIWRQCVPDPAELEEDDLPVDPLAEERLSPVPTVVHRYPGRVLLLASGTCATYCRFCTRKRKVGCPEMKASFGDLLAGIDYIARTPGVRDVILSGGEPLLLSDLLLKEVLERLHAIDHVEIIRIGTRVPVTLPERVTEGLCRLLERFHPLYINTHFNHPREITPETAEACARLAAAGIPLGNQTVLLRGVNDDPAVLAKLFSGLLRIRVRPYYLHHMDLAAGTGHFRTTVEAGLDAMRALRGPLSGLGVPHYVIDTPGGRGKVPLLPEYLERVGETVMLRTPDGERIEFPNRLPGA